MAWYSKFVHWRDKTPSGGRHALLTGSTMLLLAVPVAVVVVAGQSAKGGNNAEDILAGVDELDKHVADIAIEGSASDSGQSGDASGVQGGPLDGSLDGLNGSNSIETSLLQNGGDASANVTVNGETTPLNPLHDSYHQTVNTGDGQTRIDVSIKGGGNSTKQNIKINTSSSVNIDTGADDGGDDRFDVESRHDR